MTRKNDASASRRKFAPTPGSPSPKLSVSGAAPVNRCHSAATRPDQRCQQTGAVNQIGAPGPAARHDAQRPRCRAGRPRTKVRHRPAFLRIPGACRERTAARKPLGQAAVIEASKSTSPPAISIRTPCSRACRWPDGCQTPTSLRDSSHGIAPTIPQLRQAEVTPPGRYGVQFRMFAGRTLLMFRTTLCCTALVPGLLLSSVSPLLQPAKARGAADCECKAPQHHAVHARASSQHARRQAAAERSAQATAKVQRAPHRAIAARKKPVPVPVEAAASFASRPEQTPSSPQP